MRSLLRVTLCVVLFASALDAQTSAAGPLPAQTVPLPRWGLVAGTGLGIGLGEAVCGSCPGTTASGPAGYGRIGGAYRENLVLAFQVDWWRGESRGAVPTTTTIWNTGLIAQWYPPQGHGLHVTAGAGVGFISADVATPIPNEDVDAHGLGYQLGIGYDVRLTTHVWLSPYASFFGTPGARPSDSRETLNARAGQIGLGLTWR